MISMEMKPKTKKAGVLIVTISAIIIIVVGVFAAMILGSRAEPVFPAEHLFVDATYLLKTNETNETVNVTCTLYLTNIWEKESGNIKATAYVIETSDNLAIYKNTVSIGNIAADVCSFIVNLCIDEPFPQIIQIQRTVVIMA